MAQETLHLGPYTLELLNDHTVRIQGEKRVFVYQSQFAERLLAMAYFQEAGLLYEGKPFYCDCFVATAYLTGAQEELRWPDHREDALFQGDIFPGKRIHNDCRAAMQQLQFPIAMVSPWHCATLLAGTTEADCAIVQKCGSLQFEFCSFGEFIRYNCARASDVQYIGNEK